MLSSLSSHPDHLLIRTQELFKDKDDDVPSQNIAILGLCPMNELFFARNFISIFFNLIRKRKYLIIFMPNTKINENNNL